MGMSDFIPTNWKPNYTLKCIKCRYPISWDGIDKYICENHDCDCIYTWQGDLIIDKTPAHEKPIAYIAGALSDMCWDYLKNVRKSILWSDKINSLGYAVFIPGLDLLCGIATDNWEYTKAFTNSQPFLAKSDIVFVYPGWKNSKGTKRELALAKNLSIPIYYGEDGYKELKHLYSNTNLPESAKDALETAKNLRADNIALPYMHVDEGSYDKHVSQPAENYVIRLANSSIYLAADTYKLSVCQSIDKAKRFTKANALAYLDYHRKTADLIIENLSAKLN